MTDSDAHKALVRKQFMDMDIPEYTKDLIFALGEVEGIEDIAFALEATMCQYNLRCLLAFIITPRGEHDDCEEHDRPPINEVIN